MNYLDIKNTLETIAEKEAKTTIEGFIAYDALNYNEADCSAYIKAIIDPKSSMEMAFQFIEYSDVDGFYRTYKNDILKKQKEYGITDEDLSEFKGNNIYNLCWIVIEETAIRMSKEFGLET